MSPEAKLKFEPIYEAPIGKVGGLRLLEKLGMNVPSYFVISNEVEEDSLLGYSQDQDTYWAVRSSASVEDGIDNSFAGQFKTILNVRGDEIPKFVKEVRVSVLSESVNAYLDRKGILDKSIVMDVIVQKFIEPDKAGVWMGTDITSGILEWVYGRGENLVNGTITPVKEHLSGDSHPDEHSLRDENDISVSEMCRQIQGRLGYQVDIEFCIKDGVVWFLQLRPITVDMKEYNSPQHEQQMLGLLGEIASRGIVSGQAYRYDLYPNSWEPDSILVAESTGPGDMHAIVTSTGLVTRAGGLLSHAAVIAREFEIPCLIGVDIDKIEHKQRVNVNADVGEVHIVSEGK